MAVEFTPPAYTYVATLLDIPNPPVDVNQCSSCAGLVDTSSKKQHTEYHKAIATLAQKVNELDQDVSDILEG